jgi:hypothetical protein
MKASLVLADAAITFAVTFVVNALVTFLWSLVRHGAGVVDWETAFRFAIILGIALPLLQARGRRAPGK